MDPNNSQPVGTNPIQQPVVPQPVQAPPSTPVQQASSPSSEGSAPKKGIGKGIILIAILLLLVVGMAVYILFARMQMNKAQKTTTDSTSSVLPTPTLVPTLAPEEDLEVANPEDDLLEIEADVKDL